ncbi:hypothetical protein [Sulfobacillus thermosulfidooxidans]|uniref:hypothetical protein n=1 Tax=Sulfobacillus thermosulfidooxidans TaxID=28034 RepID=UPI0006B56C10|nr:hypothetical protein [Sulfobacillus thermosulfidooxidans]
MPHRWWMIPLRILLTAGLSVPFFAQSATPLATSQQRQHKHSQDALVMDYVNASSQNTEPGPQQWQWTIKISNVKTPENSGLFRKIRVLTSNQPQNFVKNDNIGSHLFNYPIGSNQVDNGTMTFAMQSPFPPPNASFIDVSEHDTPQSTSAEGSGNGVDVRQESSISITSLPYRQLPELPMASVLPALLVTGLGIWVYKQHRIVSP